MRPGFSPYGRGVGRKKPDSVSYRSGGSVASVRTVRGPAGPPGPPGASTGEVGGNMDGGAPDTDFSTIPPADGGAV